MIIMNYIRNFFAILFFGCLMMCLIGCVGYHAQLRKERQAEANLSLAETNLENALNELEVNEAGKTYTTESVSNYLKFGYGPNINQNNEHH